MVTNENSIHYYNDNFKLLKLMKGKIIIGYKAIRKADNVEFKSTTTTGLIKLMKENLPKIEYKKFIPKA